MSSRFASADPRVRTAVMSLIAVAVVLSTASCRWFFPPECPGVWFGDNFPPEKVPDSVRGHSGPVWGRAGGSNVIVFGWDEGLQDGGSLYMVRADGTGLTLLSPSIGDGRELGCFDERFEDGTGDFRVAFDTSPTVSPDGRTVAYHTVRESIFSGVPDIVAVTLDSGETGRITPVREPAQDEPHTAPAWSPDGTRIAFLKAKRVHIMAADGSDVIRIARSPFAAPEPPAWSPDGTRIAFRGRSGRYWSLYVVGADGSDLHLAADGEPETDVDIPYPYRFTGVGTAVWSPDGQRIALLRDVVRSERPLEIAVDAQVLDLETGTVRTILKDAVGPLIWSLDGTELLFFGQVPGSSRAIHAVTVDGDPVIRRFAGYSRGKVIGMSWSPDGAWLAVRVIPRSFGGSPEIVWVAAADGSDTHAVAWAAFDGSVEGRYGESAAAGEAER